MTTRAVLVPLMPGEPVGMPGSGSCGRGDASDASARCRCACAGRSCGPRWNWHSRLDISEQACSMATAPAGGVEVAHVNALPRVRCALRRTPMARLASGEVGGSRRVGIGWQWPADQGGPFRKRQTLLRTAIADGRRLRGCCDQRGTHRCSTIRGGHATALVPTSIAVVVCHRAAVAGDCHLHSHGRR